ncbi:DUF922 domain-containing protein [Cognatilysobacter bugurensis]|uniref:DUF922 domain-containing protein n=1 Tax=Cognatilysobacter bugurensis TaxID=543356 RepID=A0A918SVS0_9GAMM|nr:DUF922 domain-containing protein [Lysobacter bugurensis]GHA71313.1 hypothetical protein GCM10007067_04530 [Lysobacter bugurensis]
MKSLPNALIVAASLAGSPAFASAADYPVAYYEVLGSTVAQLRAELAAKGPADMAGRRSHGVTEWTLAWSYGFESPAEGECMLTHFAADLDVKVTLPRWHSPKRGSKRLLQEWERYAAALRLHEDGHVAIARAAYDEVERLRDVSWSVMTCPDLQKNIDAAANEIVKRYGQQSKKYDRDTGHGKTQGAVL